MRFKRITLAPTMRKYNRKNLMRDVIAGMIIMAVSIPISMGYAQIAGLPAVYGLYGSVFPIILFAVFSTSPQFIFGVDAAPAALIGSALLGMGIESGSKEALEVVPVLTFFVAVWLLAFYLMHAGKLVNYISAPVMGGFISGICMTIILMQVPKLLGGTAGTGELPELLEHIQETAGRINFPSLMLGLISLAILLTVKKVAPKFPSRGSTYGCSANGRMGNQDIGGSETRSAAVEDSGSGTASVEPGHHSEPFCGGRDHGRNTAR